MLIIHYQGSEIEDILMKEREEERLKKLKEYEQRVYDTGIKYIAGCDEAGRGPMARSCCCSE